MWTVTLVTEAGGGPGLWGKMMGLMKTHSHLSGEKFEFNIFGTDLGLRSYGEAEAGCWIEDHQREFICRLGEPRAEDRAAFCLGK